MSDNIQNMDFKKLRNEVQLLRDELAIMKRKYEDILYNLDDDNFSSQFLKEKDGMKTSIEQTETSIKLQAEKVDENTESIASLEVTASGVQSTVSSVFNEITQVDSKSDMTDKSKIYTYEGTNYHYSRVTKDWEKISGNSIASSFIQTDSGFELTGDVSISGDAIIGGTISGSSLKGGSFKNSKGTVSLTLGGDISSNMGDMTLSASGDRQVFQVYDNGSITDFKVQESGFLASTGTITYAYGTWEFYGDVYGVDARFG